MDMTTWYTKSPTDEYEVFQHALDPEMKLFACSPVLCDEANHANELGYLVFAHGNGAWVCHYKDCLSSITDRTVSAVARKFIQDYLNSDIRETKDQIPYNYKELEIKTATKLVTIKRLNAARLAIGRASNEAPDIETIRMRRVLRETDQELMQAQRQRCKKALLLIATAIIAIFIVVEMMSWSLDPQSKHSAPLADGTCSFDVPLQLA